MSVGIHQREAKKESHENERADKEDGVEGFVPQHVHEEQNHKCCFDRSNGQRQPHFHIAKVKRRLIDRQQCEYDESKEDAKKHAQWCWVSELAVPVSVSAMIVVRMCC